MFRLFLSPGKKLPIKALRASSQLDVEYGPEECLVDNGGATKWQSRYNPENESIVFDAGHEVRVHKMTVQSTGFKKDNPDNCTLQGGPAQDGPWTAVRSIQMQLNKSKQEFAVSGQARYWRLLVRDHQPGADVIEPLSLRYFELEGEVAQDAAAASCQPVASDASMPSGGDPAKSNASTLALPDPTATLLLELERLKVSQLITRAKADDISDALIDMTVDDDNRRASLARLIVDHGKANRLPSRMRPEAEALVGILPSTSWEDVDHSLGLVEALRLNEEVAKKVPKIQKILEDVKIKAKELRFGSAKAITDMLGDSELQSIVLYTHDLGKESKDGNFYFEENKDLRLRGLEARVKMIKTWGVHVYYALRALGKLPNYEGLVYRGTPDTQCLAEYQKGRPVQWGAWTSTTKYSDAAKGFGPGGIIFKIDVFTGKDVTQLSFFPREDEILLSPNHKFLVTSEAYEEDGFTYVDLIEQKEINPYIS